MPTIRSVALQSAAVGALLTGLIASPSLAQTTQSGANDGTAVSEIIVTARKRNETATDVPAAITALSSEDLERYGTRDFQSLQKQVPGLILQESSSNAGGSISLRGMGSSGSNPAIDQTVAMNIDGVQVGSLAIVQLSQVDIQQVEVLKGPQALFFGKNSPAGVISIRTRDPGDRLEIDGALGHEFNARETYGHVGVGGPLTDTLGARVLIAGTKMGGWLKNEVEAVPGFNFGPDKRRGPDSEEVFVRGTLKWEPTAEFSARAKYNFGKMVNNADQFDNQQRIFCPYGEPQDKGYPGYIDCKPDDISTNAIQDPRLTPFIQARIDAARAAGATYLEDFRDDPRLRNVMHLGSLEMNYQIAPAITLTSVTGLFEIDNQFNGAAMYGTGGGLSTNNTSTRKEFSQEIRLVTDMPDFPVNFAVGAYYQDTKIKNANYLAVDLYAVGFAAAPGLACSCSISDYRVNGKAKSIFGQIIVKPIDQIEIAGGARYSEETKTLSGALNGIPKTNYEVDRVKFTDTSPEVTIRWRPNQDWAVFGAWRNGFKSGGFNTGSGSAGPTITDISYRPEEVSGFEAGVKYSSRTFRANLTAYTYKYKDLQVPTFDPNTLSQRLINAASARIKGIEGDFDWSTPIEGFNLHGSFNYNKARYLDFIAGCYAGQGAPEGCVIWQNNAGANFLGQDLEGRPLVNAPDWTANFGFNYEAPVSTGMIFGLGADALYTSSTLGQLEQAPQGKQAKYVNLDATIYVGAEDGTWKLALIGRNLSEIWRSPFVSQTPLTGAAPSINPAFPGGVNPGLLPDFSGRVQRGRQIRLQATFSF